MIGNGVASGSLSMMGELSVVDGDSFVC